MSVHLKNEGHLKSVCYKMFGNDEGSFDRSQDTFYLVDVEVEDPVS